MDNPDENILGIHARKIMSLHVNPYIIFHGKVIYFTSLELRSFISDGLRVVCVWAKKGEPDCVSFMAW